MRKATLLALGLLALALPAGAAAQNVPPGNSAAAQYTETFPTSKGEENAQGPKKHVNPNTVIGSTKTKQLQEQGPEGAAVAEFTAETAPTSSGGGEESSGGASTGKREGGGQQGSGGASGGGNGNGNGGGNGSRGSGGGERSAGGGAAAGISGGNGGTGNGGGTGTASSGPSGSSAVGEVASQATGVSSGALGLWLPIAIVAVLAWAAFYLWQRRPGADRAV